ncbi:hypothetical protein ACLMJK_003859 [Lecanora helva]
MSYEPPSSAGPDLETLVRQGHGANVKLPHDLVHEAFNKVAAEIPSAVAVEHGANQMTYGELDVASTRLSRRLLRLGLQPRDRVVLLAQRSIPMIVAIFAVLKSGCQYVPMDGGVASDVALAHVLSDVEPPFVLSLAKFTQRAHQFAMAGTQVLTLEGSWEASDDFDVESGDKVTVDADDGAYIIYTSGSTGKPKGVDVTHRNVTNLLTLAPGSLRIKPGRRVAQLLSVSFDMAAWEILGTLINGGTLCLRGSDWSVTLKKVDTIIATPTILGTLKEEDFPNLKTIALAGEPCPLRLADQWAQNRSFFNCCGPTEVTIVNTMHKHHTGQPLSIGRPIPNTTVYILDENENPAPIGASGIMWVGGSCVSRGYINLPDLTDKRYRKDKFSNNGGVIFNTGDLCRWTEAGTIEPLGRIDDQVKIKGFRVELDGVSAVIESHPDVAKGCALLVDGVLHGYYVSLRPLSHETLTDFTNQSLPYYAVPSKWVCVDNFPLTINGKIDKKALKNPLTAPITDSIFSSSPSSSSLTSSSSSSSSLVSSTHKNEEGLTKITMPKPLVAVTTRSMADSQESLPEKEYLLPPERGAHKHMLLRYYFFTMYRRLFSIVFIGNLVAIITIFAYRRTLNNLTLSDLATATAANVTASLLMRQDYVINLLFTIACSVPTSMPLFIRRNCAKIFHIGGIHSSAGTAATFWFTALTIAATIGVAVPDQFSPGKHRVAILLIIYIILLLFAFIAVTAYPTFRMKRHDIFEKTHRFAGWTILILFWILTVLSDDASRGKSSLAKTLRQDPTLYLLIVSTISVILPWIRLRKVPVRSEVLSSHAIRLHFAYTNTYPGTAVRISERPLMEWHAFATVAKPGVDGFSLVVSNAGDWTKRQIGRAPEKIWVRGIPACGVLRIAPLFRRIVLVATGSGIGPCLPVLLAKKLPMRVFWSTPAPEDTFGEEIINSVRGADKHAVIWNTRKQGKPDMVKEAWKLVVESGRNADGGFAVEAVCIIANKKVTEMVVRGMETRGMAAYGAIFDS